MPITDSAKKALRQSHRRHAANLEKAKAFKAAIKVFKKTKTAADLSKVFQTLDKAAKVNVVYKNKASRLKSRLSKLLTK